MCVSPPPPLQNYQLLTFCVLFFKKITSRSKIGIQKVGLHAVMPLSNLKIKIWFKETSGKSMTSLDFFSDEKPTLFPMPDATVNWLHF